MARVGNGARGGGRPDAGAAQTVLAVSRRGKFMVGSPLFERGGEQYPLADNKKLQPREGELLLCRIGRKGAQPLASLGRADVARDVVAALVADRGLRPSFPKALHAEARESIASLEADHGPRRDLTAEPTFTVDPASARDFDDAVSARREGDGVRIWIHIADVAAHVRPGSGVDREARERANSTYAPGIVSPMLPRELSNDACSLNPGVERLAVTAEIELDADAGVRGASFYRSLIRSDQRLTYDELDLIFSGRRKPQAEISEPLALARKVAATLAEQAAGRSLTVSGSEPEFEFDDDGHVKLAREVPETESHRLIERLMILSNEQVANVLERKGVPALFRNHEQPDPARIEHLVDQLAALDLPSPPLAENLSPSEAGAFAAEASAMLAVEAKRRGHGAVTWSSLVLRSLKPARYSDQNKGHAGLASPAYSHFTSPIRRYPDLIVHRALLATLGAGETAPERAEVAQIAEHCSDTERDSMKIERKGDDICLGFLLERELFERGPDQAFEGEVSGVIGAGAFIRFRGEKADVYEGFLPARRIGGDRWELNDTDSALVGNRTGKRLGMGDPIEITVESVETARGRVDLLPAKSGAGNGKAAKSGGRSGGKQDSASRHGGEGGGEPKPKGKRKKNKRKKDKGKPKRKDGGQDRGSGGKGGKDKGGAPGGQGKEKDGAGNGNKGGQGNKGSRGKAGGKPQSGDGKQRSASGRRSRG